MKLFGGHPRPRFGPPPGPGRGGSSSRHGGAARGDGRAAAPAAPTAYTVFGKAQPLVWGSSSSVPVGNLHVPFVSGKTNNVAIAKSDAKLADPDENPKPLAGDAISRPDLHAATTRSSARTRSSRMAQAEHAGPDARHLEQAATFAGQGREVPGQHPGPHRLRRELRRPARPLARQRRRPGRRPPGLREHRVLLGQPRPVDRRQGPAASRRQARSSTTSRSGPRTRSSSPAS